MRGACADSVTQIVLGSRALQSSAGPCFQVSSQFLQIKLFATGSGELRVYSSLSSLLLAGLCLSQPSSVVISSDERLSP